MHILDQCIWNCFLSFLSFCFLTLCGPLEVILHPSGLKTTNLHVSLHWVGCALFTRNKQSLGMNKLSQAALGIKGKVRESAELWRFFLSVLIFMGHKNLIQNVNLLKKIIISSVTVHLSLVSQKWTILVLSCLTVQEKSTFILWKIILCM